MFPCVKEKALMKQDERRKYPRIKTDNLMSYVCLDNDGNELGEVDDDREGNRIALRNTENREPKNAAELKGPDVSGG